MKRKDFFKAFGFGVAAAVVAPKLIAEAMEEAPVVIKDYYPVTGKRAEIGNVLMTDAKGVAGWAEEPKYHEYHSAVVKKVGIGDHAEIVLESGSLAIIARLYDVLLLSQAVTITKIDFPNIYVSPYGKWIDKPKSNSKVFCTMIGNDYIEKQL